MRKPKHTKGPWECITREESDGIWSYIGPVYNKTNDIAKIDTCNEDRLADVNLIAAAPDLLEALEHTLADLKRCEAHFNKTKDFGVSSLALGLAEQAIAKAKGEQ